MSKNDQDPRKSDKHEREPDLLSSRMGQRLVSRAALLERVIDQFVAEHGTDGASERADERPEQATESVDARDEAVADGG